MTAKAALNEELANARNRLASALDSLAELLHESANGARCSERVPLPLIRARLDGVAELSDQHDATRAAYGEAVRAQRRAEYAMKTGIAK